MFGATCHTGHLFFIRSTSGRCAPDAPLPHCGSDGGGEAGDGRLFRGAGKVWTHPIPPHEAVFQGSRGK